MPVDVRLRGPGTFAAEGFTHAPTASLQPSRGDERSVGELLIDADHHSRTLLLDVAAEDASGLLRSWTSTVTSAGQLWRTLPGAKFAPPGSSRLVERVEGQAASIAADLASARWPGDGVGDQRLLDVGQNFDRARELVKKYGADIEARHTPVRGDLEAARTRIVHTLYVATHGVLVALNQEGRRRAANPSRAEALHAAKTSSRSRYEVGPGVRWADRLSVVERTLSDYLQPGRYAQALNGEHPARAGGLPRLRETLARFDIQAHHTLRRGPAPGNIALVAGTESMLLAAALVLNRAALETSPGIEQTAGGETPQAGYDQFEASLGTAGGAWTGLARRWGDLMPPGTQLDPALSAAAAGLRAACRELTHKGDHLASPATIASKVDLSEAQTLLAHYLATGSDIAEATRPALRDTTLTAPARAVLHRLGQDVDEGLLPEGAEDLGDQVNAADIASNRLVPLPRALVQALDAATTAAARMTATAAQHAPRDQLPLPPAAEPRLPGQLGVTERGGPAAERRTGPRPGPSR